MRPQLDFPVLSVEALRSLREDQPSNAEISRAYQRFKRPARPAPRGLLVSRWMIAGLVMGLGVAFGSEAIVQRLQPARPTRSSAVAMVAPTARRAAASRAPQSSQRNDPQTATPDLPVPVGKFESAPRATSTVSAKAPRVAVDDHAPADRTLWIKAAEGLRNNDLDETRSALATLEHTGSSADREAARLIRAQLLLHQGETGGARTLLQDLANNAQSAAVRAKALSLLSAQSNSALNLAPSGT